MEARQGGGDPSSPGAGHPNPQLGCARCSGKFVKRKGPNEDEHSHTRKVVATSADEEPRQEGKSEAKKQQCPQVQGSPDGHTLNLGRLIAAKQRVNVRIYLVYFFSSRSAATKFKYSCKSVDDRPSCNLPVRSAQVSSVEDLCLVQHQHHRCRTWTLCERCPIQQVLKTTPVCKIKKGPHTKKSPRLWHTN